MNVTKIAALYPFYLDALRQLPTGRRLDDMLATVQLALLLKANAYAGSPNRWVTLRDLDNPVQRFDELGLPSEEELRELVPARLFAWVCQQQPAQPTYSDDLDGMLAEYHAGLGAATGWRVTANEMMPALQGVPGQPVPPTGRNGGRYATWVGSAQELATLLRGLHAYRAKRRKQTRRLLAQLWAYHIIQQQALVAVPVLAAEPVSNELCDAPTASVGMLPRLVGRLRRVLAAKIHQVAIAAEAVLGEGAQVA